MHLMSIKFIYHLANQHRNLEHHRLLGWCSNYFSYCQSPWSMYLVRKKRWLLGPTSPRWNAETARCSTSPGPGSNRNHRFIMVTDWSSPQDRWKTEGLPKDSSFWSSADVIFIGAGRRFQQFAGIGQSLNSQFFLLYLEVFHKLSSLFKKRKHHWPWESLLLVHWLFS